MLARPLLVLSAALAFAGCGGAGAPRACTAIGALNGGSVQLGSRDGLPTSGVVHVRACLGATCEDSTTTWDQVAQGLDTWFVTVPGLAGPAPVTLSLTLTDDRGVRVVDGRTTVVPQRVQPNGPGCDPVAWQARATIDR